MKLGLSRFESGRPCHVFWPCLMERLGLSIPMDRVQFPTRPQSSTIERSNKAERDKRCKCTKQNDRVMTHESPTNKERAITLESTIESDRARQTDRTINRDRVVIGDRNKNGERASHAHIAYGLIRGRTYESIEKPKTPPSWENVRRLCRKYGPANFQEPTCMSS